MVGRYRKSWADKRTSLSSSTLDGVPFNTPGSPERKKNFILYLTIRDERDALLLVKGAGPWDHSSACNKVMIMARENKKKKKKTQHLAERMDDIDRFLAYASTHRDARTPALHLTIPADTWIRHPAWQ